MRRRHGFPILLGGVAIGIALLAIPWRLRLERESKSPEIVLPAVNQTKSISATLRVLPCYRPEELVCLNKPFTVPPIDQPFLLRLLRYGERVPDRLKRFDRIAEITVVDTNNVSWNVVLFDVGKCPVTYLVNGHVYSRVGPYINLDPSDKAGRYEDEAICLYGWLQMICRGKEGRDYAPQFRDRLAKSAGLQDKY